MNRPNYIFTKNLYDRAAAIHKYNFPSEAISFINHLKSKGFKVSFYRNPQIDIDKNTLELSYLIELYLTLEEKSEVLRVVILNNQWTNHKLEWWFMFSEYRHNWIGKGNEFDKFKYLIDSFLQSDMCITPVSNKSCPLCRINTINKFNYCIRCGSASS